MFILNKTLLDLILNNFTALPSNEVFTDEQNLSVIYNLYLHIASCFSMSNSKIKLITKLLKQLYENNMLETQHAQLLLLHK